eukprot:Colp12_sorted_trinity150504_noHs@32878
MKTLLLLVVCICLANASSRREIRELPGLKETLPSRIFTGYLSINATTPKEIFYWFIESENNPLQSPVTVWYQGGPGCSGGIALLTENGPFLVHKDGLKINPWGWNRLSNMLFIDAPANVGFSYAVDPNDINSNNDITAVCSGVS